MTLLCHIYRCAIFTLNNKKTLANSVDPDQTALEIYELPPGPEVIKSFHTKLS